MNTADEGAITNQGKTLRAMRFLFLSYDSQNVVSRTSLLAAPVLVRFMPHTFIHTYYLGSYLYRQQGTCLQDCEKPVKRPTLVPCTV
jgi:hypothetical protein